MLNKLIVFSLCVSFLGCVSKKLSSDDVVMKRQWVRRVSPTKFLTRNSASQRFSPLLLSSQLVQGSSFGGIKAFSKRTGLVKWKIDDKDGVASHGRISSGKLLFGSYSRKASSYDIKSKKFDWSVALDSSPLSFSEIVGNKIFSLTDLGTLYALAVDTGAVLWSVKKPAKKELQIFGAPSPVVYGNQVIAAFPDGSVASFDQSSGKQKWVLRFDSYQKFEDADFLEIDGSNLFIGSFDEAFYNVNPANGNVKWRVMQGPVSSVAVDGSRLYYSSNKGEIICLDKSSGKIIFQKSVLKGVGNKPAIMDNLLFVSDSKGPIYVLDKNLGSVLSEYESGVAISSDFSIDSKRKKVYFLSNKGNLFKFGIERQF